VADAVLLLTSELVTNAVLHAGSDVSLIVRCEDRTVRVEIEDHSTELPVPGRSPDASAGRGLMLVDVMSGRWGIERRPMGKTVWFEVPA
jgi:anti-sigma regulatory factor (Ser/Thr protein kinase)